jgi:hypothetical protein
MERRAARLELATHWASQSKYRKGDRSSSGEKPRVIKELAHLLERERISGCIPVIIALPVESFTSMPSKDWQEVEKRDPSLRAELREQLLRPLGFKERGIQCRVARRTHSVRGQPAAWRGTLGRRAWLRERPPRRAMAASFPLTFSTSPRSTSLGTYVKANTHGDPSRCYPF